MMRSRRFSVNKKKKRSRDSSKSVSLPERGQRSWWFIFLDCDIEPGCESVMSNNLTSPVVLLIKDTPSSRVHLIKWCDLLNFCRTSGCSDSSFWCQKKKGNFREIQLHCSISHYYLISCAPLLFFLSVTISSHCHDSSSSFIPSPVWWLTHVRDGDSRRQQHLTVPQLLTFLGLMSRGQCRSSQRAISLRSAADREWAATYRNRPLYSNTVLFCTLWASILVSHPTACAHVKDHVCAQLTAVFSHTYYSFKYVFWYRKDIKLFYHTLDMMQCISNTDGCQIYLWNDKWHTED